MTDLPRPNADAAPTILVIFGITGDLSRRKLLPALWHLYRADVLPAQFRVVGFSRRDFSEKTALAELLHAVLAEQFAHADADRVERFIDMFSYQQGHFDEPDKYAALGVCLSDIERDLGASANKLFYLAVAPSHYESVFQNIHDADLATEHADGAVWTRILVEKPFGRDSETAQELDAKLGALFSEKQIYRIDHYLAKETVQNILNFRFSNFLFEPAWNKNGIEKVHIELLETLGMEGRGAFYSDTGTLRDVGQNHLLQILAMIAMKNPGSFDADHVRKQRAEIFASLKQVEDIPRNSVRAQYEAFRNESGVPEDSTAETYFKLRVYLDDPDWEGVPFILESGKSMKESVSRATIYFKHATSLLCPTEQGDGCQDTLSFEMKPEEGITICFWAKKPGFSQTIERRRLHFSYSQNGNEERLPDAYERVLYDCIRGDQTLFMSTDEVRDAWRFITPILEGWQEAPLETYPQGSWGPESRKALDSIA